MRLTRRLCRSWQTRKESYKNSAHDVQSVKMEDAGRLTDDASQEVERQQKEAAFAKWQDRKKRIRNRAAAASHDRDGGQGHGERNTFGADTKDIGDDVSAGYDVRDRGGRGSIDGLGGHVDENSKDAEHIVLGDRLGRVGGKDVRDVGDEIRESADVGVSVEGGRGNVGGEKWGTDGLDSKDSFSTTRAGEIQTWGPPDLMSGLFKEDIAASEMTIEGPGRTPQGQGSEMRSSASHDTDSAQNAVSNCWAEDDAPNSPRTGSSTEGSLEENVTGSVEKVAVLAENSMAHGLPLDSSSSLKEIRELIKQEKLPIKTGSRKKVCL